MKTLTFPTIVSSISSRVDGSLGLRISTPELSNEEKVELMNFHGVNAQATLMPLDAIADEEMIIDTDLETKTPSKRQRAIIYVIWEKQGKSGEFRDFYKKMMDKIAEGLKLKYLENI